MISIGQLKIGCNHYFSIIFQIVTRKSVLKSVAPWLPPRFTVLFQIQSAKAC
ncbi:conserved hypothetical protein [delta proteobacterium NaphS2]|nr:conserved hypothetical protein [delta proteobacterium NaphS2]